jgi:DNA-binding FadR family transcriptional regulator
MDQTRTDSGPLPYSRIGGQGGTLAQQVAEQIIELMASRHLQPGDTLPAQQELSELLGVSRTVIREGLQLLSGLGVIRVSQGVRAQVTTADTSALRTVLRISAGTGTKGMQNLLMVRAILEPEIAAVAALKAKPEHIRRLQQAIVEMDLAHDDVERYVKADQDFHLALAEATDNELLPAMLNPIVHLLQEMRRIAVRVPGAAGRAQAYHRLVLDRVQNRDPQGASAAMREHLAQIRGEVDVPPSSKEA